MEQPIAGSNSVSLRLMRGLPWLVLACSGAFIAARALYGPFEFLVPVRSPMNAQSVFGLAALLILAGRASRNSEKSPNGKALRGCRLWIWVLALSLLTAAAFARSLNFYFLSDDFVHLKIANAPIRSNLRALLALGGGDGFYRPLGYLSLLLNATWAGHDPLAWHISSLALHIANVLLLFLLALRLCSSRRAAFFAAALFALHGTRPEVAVWLAGRFDLLATLFVLLGLLLFLRARERAEPGGGFFHLLSLAAMILGFLCKESAAIFPLLLLLLLMAENDLSRKSLGVLIPYFVTAAALFALRWALVGGIGGYRDARTGRPEVLAIGLLPSLKALLLRLWGVLYFPINWESQPGLPLGILIAGYLLALAWIARSRPRRGAILFSLGFVLISALPPLQQLLIGSDLLKSRLLYLPSAGFCLMLAHAVEGLPRRRDWIAPAVILGFSLVALQHNLDSWGYAASKAKAACASAAACAGAGSGPLLVSGLPKFLRGVYFFANGFPECVEMQRKGPMPPVQLQPGSDPAAGAGAPNLVWDPATDELRCQHR